MKRFLLALTMAFLVGLIPYSTKVKAQELQKGPAPSCDGLAQAYCECQANVPPELLKTACGHLFQLAVAACDGPFICNK